MFSLVDLFVPHSAINTFEDLNERKSGGSRQGNFSNARTYFVPSHDLTRQRWRTFLVVSHGHTRGIYMLGNARISKSWHRAKSTTVLLPFVDAFWRMHTFIVGRCSTFHGEFRFSRPSSLLRNGIVKFSDLWCTNL